MKKVMSFALAALFWMTSANASITVDRANEVLAELHANNTKAEQAIEFIFSNVDKVEARRISRQIVIAHEAGTLQQDLAEIAANVKVKRVTGSGLHTGNYSTLKNVAIGVAVVAVVYYVLSTNPMVSFEGGMLGSSGGFYL